MGTPSKALRIVYDNDPMDPRKEFDNVGTMIIFHPRYNLGDSHRFSEPRDWLESFAVELGMDSEKAYNLSSEKLWNFVNKKALILPLYLYDHSGISISVNDFRDQWDSGQVGWIYVTYETIRKEYQVKHVTKKALEWAREVLVSEVNIYDMFLRNDVYGFECIDESGEIVDSCYGYYGDNLKKNGMWEAIPEEYRKLDPIFPWDHN